MDVSITKPYPPTWRALLALAIVPGFAAFLMATVEPSYAGLDSQYERIWRTGVIFSLFGAYPPAVVFGLPAYFILRSKVAGTWLNCAITGAAVAGLPWLLLTLFGPAADQASIGDRATVIDGTRTAYGWIVELQFIGLIAPYGAVAGLLFWVIAAAGSKRAKPQN